MTKPSELFCRLATMIVGTENFTLFYLTLDTIQTDKAVTDLGDGKIFLSYVMKLQDYRVTLPAHGTL